MPRPHPPEFRAEAIRLLVVGSVRFVRRRLVLGSRRVVFVVGWIRTMSMAAARRV